MKVVFNDGTLIQMIKNRVEAFPDRTMAKQKRNGAWLHLSWRELGNRIEKLGLAFEKLGLKPGCVAAILSETRMEWMIADFAIMSCGGVTVGIYTTSTPAQMRYLLEHSEAMLLIVENAALLRRIIPALEGLSFLKHVIAMEPGECGEILQGCLSMKEMFEEKIDETQSKEFWDRVFDRVNNPEAPVSYIYTSGTTGPPKGAILCHRNFLTAAKAYLGAVDIDSEDSLMSVLPLAHALQRALDYTTMTGGGKIYYAESIKTLVTDVKEAKPTIIAGVPRLFEKIFEAIRSKAEASGSFKKKVFYWSISVAHEFAARKQNKQPIPFWLTLRYKLAYAMVFGKINEAMGGNIRFMGSGGASLSTDLAKFFTACGIPVMEAWGLTESSAMGTINRLDDFKFGSVGKTISGAEIMLAEDGEILIRGDCLFLGYYKMDPKESASNYSNGWFLTGDIGALDEEGNLSITDRKKELIITSYGKNISPQNIENILNSSPLIANSFAFGDNQKYLVGLIVPERDRLLARLTEEGAMYNPNIPIHESVEARKMFETEMEKINQRLANHEKIRRFAILPNDFTIDTGELTPTLKLKRRNIVAKYKDLIKSLYGEDWLE